MNSSEVARIGDLRLTSGSTLPSAEVAYVTYGQLALDKRNVILITLGRASNAYDATPYLDRIRAKVLYVLSRTDTLFPPSLEPAVTGGLKAAGVDARYHLLDSEHGHQASGRDSAKWATVLRALLDELRE